MTKWVKIALEIGGDVLAILCIFVLGFGLIVIGDAMTGGIAP